jgi:hypothetical protein
VNESLYFVFGGLAFLAVVLLWAWRTSRNRVRPAQSDHREGVSPSALDLLPDMAVEDLFPTQDWVFLSRLGHKHIQRLYLSERRAIGISWLVELRRRAWGLMKFHVRAARLEAELSLWLELRVLTAFLLFFALHTVGLILLRSAGPVRFRRTAFYVASAATRKYRIGTAILETLESGRLSAVKT